MKQSIAFDIYGTLIDPMALGQELETMLGTLAADFNNLWRQKQLEYSFRKAAMGSFNHFSECTSQALQYCDTYFNTQLENDQKSKLLGMYRELPAFQEVRECLTILKERKHEVIALSNGKKDDLISLFRHAGILGFFDHILSADEVRTFKPSPAVYQLLADRSSSPIESTWMVSSNSFDVIGAASFGLKTAWVQRGPNPVFDPFNIDYTVSVSSISALIEIFED